MRMLIIDDFYPDPWAVRQYALSLPFQEVNSVQERNYYKGKLTTQNHPFSQYGLELIARNLGKLITWPTQTGEFRLILERAKNDLYRKTWIHFDSMVARYAGIVYLNPPEQCDGGTAFYRHKETNWEVLPDFGSPSWVEATMRTGKSFDTLLETLQKDGFEINEKWDLVLQVPMQFNRCIVFDSRQFHARVNGFGNSPLDGRLSQNFFFDVLT
jgi:hypothetical protein